MLENRENLKKRCSKCGTTKCVSEFGKAKKNKDGLNCWCKSCARASYKKYMSENRLLVNERKKDKYYLDVEVIRKQKREWHNLNKEKSLQIQKKYRTSNAALCNLRARNWRNKNSERVKAYAMLYRIANAETRNLRRKEWGLLNSHVIKAYTQNRRALIKSSGGKLSRDIAQRLKVLQRGKCACCGEPLGEDYHLDHIMPLALGGTNSDDNMQLLRKKCNLQKSAKHPVDFMQQRGFLL